MIPNHAPLAAVLGIAAILVALGYGMNHSSYNVWGGFWVAPVLLALSLPVANRAARLDGDATGRIVLVAAVVKVLVAPLLRYWMAFSLYGGFSDSADYHQAGVLLAPLFRHGIYRDLGHISGTRFVELLTGQVYAFTGPTRFGGFMVFSWFSFIGCYFFYRAFRLAYPDGDGRRYALLVFFFPTLLFWPSSIGKEAFMVLVLGAAALGAAQLFAGRFRGLVWLALGLWGAAVVRPHMALIVGGGLVAAAPLAVLRGGADGHRRQRGRLGGAVLVLALLVAGPALIGVAQNFFHLQSLNSQTAQEVLDETTRRSGKTGSTFTSISPNNPVGFVRSGVTVLFRPFPFEARNAQAMLTSLEGLSLLALCVLSGRRLARLPAELFRRPYLVFGLVYTLAFIYAFSALGNFGILARERSQVLPALFVVLCIPKRSAHAR
ncbi:MAG TPA: hypothetical protein VEN99_13935 [Acidimicrobiia bacterium]|nr:hypothetical protein [Acidimicrobiia bacterium]